MDSLSYKTISVNKATAQKEWVVVDATDQVLGRLGTKVAKLLRGVQTKLYTMWIVVTMSSLSMRIKSGLPVRNGMIAFICATRDIRVGKGNLLRLR